MGKKVPGSTVLERNLGDPQSLPVMPHPMAVRKTEADPSVSTERGYVKKQM